MRAVPAVDGGGEDGLAEHPRLAGSHVAHDLDAGRLRGGIRRGDRDRREVVLRRDGVVGAAPELVDGAAEGWP